MVSYRWVCKPDFNINNENYGQELSEFRIHGSVHRDSILIRSNKMQQYAGIYLLQIYSTLLETWSGL